MKLKSSLENIVNRTHPLLLDIKADTSYRKTKNSWSRKEILGHLVDSAQVNFHRFIQSQFKSNLVFDPYEQNRWVKLQNYNSRDWQEIISIWKSFNLHIVRLLENIDAEKQNKLTANHNFDIICWKLVEKGTQSSLGYLIEDYIGHLEHHLDQIYNY